MNSPLVLIHYQNLMPGSRLVHRLEELGFRVMSASPSSSLADQVRELSPMAMVCDLEPDVDQHLEAIRTIKGDLQTQHLPILAYANLGDGLEEAARLAGATLIADRSGVLSQLPNLMDHILEVH